jgi:photosystem II stability/assembly factor-like uncharacterized protein
MKHISLLLFALVCYTSRLLAQDFWEQLYFPDSVSIRCITTNELGDIFVGVGYDNQTGGIYRSNNSGMSWEMVYNIGEFGVLSITVNEAGYIYAGTNKSSESLLVSKDNGEIWENIELTPAAYGNVMKILCIGNDTIYVSTWEASGSFINYSFDGGDTWNYSYVTNHSGLEYVSDIDVLSTGEIFVSINGFSWGEGGVYKSTDAGVSWESVGLFNHQVMTLEINANNEVFTGDWWVINNDPPGIHALYEGTNTFDFIFDAYHVTDIVIDTDETIYAAANEGVVYSLDNGLTFNQIEDELSRYIEYLHISHNWFLYGTNQDKLVRSIDPITKVVETYESEKTVSTYPNPTNNFLTVKVEQKHWQNNPYEVHVYSITGKVVYKNKGRFESDHFLMNVSLLTSGYYLIEIKQRDYIYKSSFVKN